MRTQDILIKPRVTEKSLEAGKAQDKKPTVVSFFVATGASKHQIKQRVESLFDVTTGEIRTFMRKGKVKRVGQKRLFKSRSDRKIANIQITKGDVSVFPKS